MYQFQLDRFSPSWNSCQTAVEKANNSCQTAFKQLLLNLKLYNINFGHRVELCAKFQLDRLSLSWNNCQTAVKKDTHIYKTAFEKFKL